MVVLSYDTIGIDYSDLRKPDPRIATVIDRALGSAKTVLNVGAGACSYEPAGRQVTAIEPSLEMIRQRGATAALAIQGHAENLPFEDNSFDASMAVLTVHHWADKAQGLREMRRVTRGPVVVLTFDPEHQDFWLFDYLPELVALDEAQMPRMADMSSGLGTSTFQQLPSPTTVSTDSCAPIGGARQPISIPEFVGECPLFGRSTALRVWSDWPATSTGAIGRSDTRHF